MNSCPHQPSNFSSRELGVITIEEQQVTNADGIAGH